MNTLNSSVNSFKSLTQKSEMFTTKQVADQLHTSSKVVLTNAKKCLKNKVFENGKTTYFTKAEVTLILEQMKSNNKTHSSDLYFKSKGATTTELTPSLRMIEAMKMFEEAANEEIKRLQAENQVLVSYKDDTEKKLANGELIETPSENVRNHLWQNIQKVGTSMNDYRKAWHEFWALVKRDTSIDVKTRASNKDMKPLDYICNELSMEDFNKIFALSEKMKKEYCGE